MLGIHTASGDIAYAFSVPCSICREPTQDHIRTRLGARQQGNDWQMDHGKLTMTLRCQSMAAEQEGIMEGLRRALAGWSGGSGSKRRGYSYSP